MKKQTALLTVVTIIIAIIVAGILIYNKAQKQSKITANNDEQIQNDLNTLQLDDGEEDFQALDDDLQNLE
jgi:uncharacterized protein YpmB